ncbi:MAG: alpha/beta hydrolase [Acidobacteriota bacterium]
MTQRVLTAAACIVPLLACLACGGREQPGTPETAMESLENGSFVEQVGSRTIHYEVHGSGPVVMVVPNSWGLSLEGLRGLFGALERHVTMVYFDPRGIGGSGPVEVPEDMGLEAVRADFHALREHLGLERVHAIGWSNGAMNLLLLAGERPETLRSAIVVHGVARFVPEDMQAVGAKFPELFRDFGELQQELAASEAPAEEKTARMKAFWLERYFPAMTGDPETALPRILGAFRPAQFSYEHAMYTQQTYPTFDATEALPRITVPMMVIAGAHDMLPVERAREIAERAPSVRFELFENSGHFAPLEEPERFERVVTGFLDVR